MAAVRRGFPWEWVLIGVLLAVGLGLVIYAFLPPAAPPYVG